MSSFFKYISESPYRLISLSSASSPRILRQKATAADHAIKVGLPVEVSLRSIFGDDELPNCADKVKAISGDAQARTIYRQLWPYRLSSDGLPINDIEDLARIEPEGLDNPPFYALQRTFLHEYFSFLSTTNSWALRGTLLHWMALHRDEAHEIYLRSLLSGEGEDEINARNTVVNAQNVLTLHLIRQASDIALLKLRQGNESLFQSLIQTISANLDQEVVDRVYADTLVVEGDRERAKVQELTERTRIALEEKGWSPDSAPFNPDEVRTLAALAKALEGRHPSVALWKKAEKERVDQIGAAMNRYAVDLFDTARDIGLAITVLRQAHALPVTTELRDEIALNLDVLERSVSSDTVWGVSTQEPNHHTRPSVGTMPTSRAGRSNNLRPVTGPPILLTLNGCGSKLYKGMRYGPNPSWHYATLYFVLLYIPVFPITRYVVSDAPTRGWHFHGREPFTRWHQVHLALAVALGLWVIIAGSRPSDKSLSQPVTVTAVESPSQVSTVSGSADSATGVSDGASANTDAARVANEMRRKSLLTEGKRLQHDITVDIATLHGDTTTLNEARMVLQKEEDTLKEQQGRVDANRLNLDHSSPTSVDTFNQSVEAFNVNTQVYRRDQSQFNASVTAYNHRLHKLKAKERRLDEIRHALGD